MKWISVKDRLPEDKQLIIIFSGKVDVAEYQKDRNEFGRFPNYTPQDRAIYYYYPEVTHWMPLPKPPKSKQ